MNKPQLTYFENEDVLHLVVKAGVESNSVELSPNITVELNELGEIIGIEILDASAFLRDSVLDSIQGRILRLAQPVLA